MSANSILAALYLCLLTSFSWVLILCSSSTPEEQLLYNSVLVSSLRYPGKTIKPYEWFYMRVELPPQFSAMSVNMVSNADIDQGSIEKLSKTTVPMICFRDGRPPLPDVSDSSLKNLVLHNLLNGLVGGIHNSQETEQCFSFQKNMTMTFTNEQISPGVWYIGFFNGIGPVRTQSKMITRGSAYLFSANITIEGCTTSTMWGPYCNQTIDPLSCTRSVIYKHPRNLLDVKRNEGRQLASNSSILTTAESLLTCRNSYEGVCFGDEELKLYSLDITSTMFQLKIVATDIRLNQTSAVNNTTNVSETLITCYARHNAMPLKSSHDHSGDISRTPLIIELPKDGRWFFSFEAVNQTKVDGVVREKYIKADLCFSLELQVRECPLGKGGLNCTWESHILQRVLRRSSSVPFESYYLPIGEMMSMNSANFPLDPLLSNSSHDGGLDVAWTYFLLDVPHGAAGANLHVQLTSNEKVNFEIYARFGGIPSLDAWDYYTNGTSRSNGSMFLSLNDSSEERLNFYILYATEGTWSFGLRHGSGNPKRQISMSVGLEGCPKRCSDHGKCHTMMDESGLTLYSFCLCGRNHGGFDCSIELVSAEGHMWQSVALIASNAAAILPAFWALRQKAFPEWVLFTSSGISSGLYHSCDVGTWCALSFHVLQFMDFWLSFMAVVSTFVYMATIDEVSKRTIHTIVAILTALMAATGATRSTNIILVIAIGTSGLLIGWMIEFSTANRMIYCLPRFHLNVSERWQNSKEWICDLIETLRKRFLWSFVIVGFVALSAAAISWKLETNETYWIWHSLWHVTIYTSSFFFLCSTAVKGDNPQYPATEYELTRQNSSSRVE